MKVGIVKGIGGGGGMIRVNGSGSSGGIGVDTWDLPIKTSINPNKA